MRERDNEIKSLMDYIKINNPEFLASHAYQTSCPDCTRKEAKVSSLEGRIKELELYIRK